MCCLTSQLVAHCTGLALTFFVTLRALSHNDPLLTLKGQPSFKMLKPQKASDKSLPDAGGTARQARARLRVVRNIVCGSGMATAAGGNTLAAWPNGKASDYDLVEFASAYV